MKAQRFIDLTPEWWLESISKREIQDIASRIWDNPMLRDQYVYTLFTGWQQSKVLPLYRTPFEPEKVPAWFEGWEKVGNDDWLHWLWNRDQHFRLVWDGILGGIEATDQNGEPLRMRPGLQHPLKVNYSPIGLPKTLHDFIEDCHRAGIELTWNLECPEVVAVFGKGGEE